MKTRTKLGASILAVIGMLLLGARSGSAQTYLGLQADWSDDWDAGVGARVLHNIERANLEFVGSFDLYFPDGPVDFWDANANLFYHFHLAEDPHVLPYLGGGLNVAHVSNGADHTELGLNLGGGFRFPMATVSPYIEARTTLSDLDQSILTIGLIFGHAHGM